MATSVFDETGANMINKTRHIFSVALYNRIVGVTSSSTGDGPTEVTLRLQLTDTIKITTPTTTTAVWWRHGFRFPPYVRFVLLRGVEKGGPKHKAVWEQIASTWDDGGSGEQ